MAFKILGRDGVNLTTAGSSAEHLSAESRKIVNVANPTSAQDAATKDYVDNATTAASSALDGTFVIKNTADQTKQMNFDVSGVAAGQTRTVVMPNANVNLGLVATAIQSSEKGAANGVATLNASGKLPNSQVPAIAITDTFVVASQAAMLALSTAETGDVAVRTDEGKSYILAGADYSVLGDWQELLTPVSPVQSVNGQTGTVVLDSDDIAEGATNLYYTSARFDADLATKDTADLAEGANLYFTEARVLGTDLAGFVVGADSAIAATDTVLQAFEKAQGQIAAAKQAASDAQADATQALSDISDHLSDTTDAHDASAISVLDTGSNFTSTDVEGALAESMDAAQAAQADATQALSDIANHMADSTDAHDASAISIVDTGNNFTATDVEGALEEAMDAAQAAQADATEALSYQGQSFEAGVAGESFAADQVWLVRRAKSGETAGRYYKASADSAENSRVVGFIVVGASAVSAAGTIRVYKLGSAALGSSDTVFTTPTDLNKAVFLHQSTAGKWTLAPSETAGQWIKEVGFVADAGIIEFQPGMLIQA